MTIHLVTFSDESMSRARELCANSAYEQGVDRTWPWCKESVERYTVAREHLNLFVQPHDTRRAWAWWAWKPVILDHQMRQMRDGDTCAYSDAGIEFINNISHIIDGMDQDIFLFGNNWEHAHWCKRDVVDEVWPDDRAPTTLDVMLLPQRESPAPDPNATWSRFGKQCQASVIFFRVSDYSRKFVKEWLDWCLFEGGRLIDDSPSRTPNHPEFREHRHDQAILTTLAYREGIKLHYWPTSYNDGAFSYDKIAEYAGDDYPILFNHHRRRNHEWSEAA